MKINKQILVGMLLATVFNQYALAAQQFMEVEPLMGVKQQDGKVIYTGKIKYPERACNYIGAFPYALKYQSINRTLEPYFTLKFEASSPKEPTFKQIPGNRQGRPLVSADGNSYLNLKLTLTPKGDGVYQDNVLRVGMNPLEGQLNVYCYFTGSGAEFGSFGGVTLGTGNVVTLDQTCSLNSDADQNVRLEDIFLQNLKTNGEVYGGQFSIQLNCQGATVRNSYISYTDGVNSANTGTVLTADSTATARDVGFKIYDTSNPTNAITYAPVSSLPFASLSGDSNIQLFASNVNNGGMFSKTYKVYYAKTSNNPTAGSVTGKLVYNIYYR